MRIWTSEHIFNHPWETVTKAAWRKYPNPMNTAVQSIDVLDRNIDSNTGNLKTHRLIQTCWRMPSWIYKLISINPECYVSEKSELDVSKRVMTACSTNLSMVQNLAIEEKLTYSQHPSDPQKTVMVNESTITIKGMPLSDYLENIIEKTMESKSQAGKQAMEWVIERINNEVKELSNTHFPLVAENYL